MKNIYKLLTIWIIIFVLVISATPANATAIQTPTAKKSMALDMKATQNWTKILSTFEARPPKEIVKEKLYKTVPVYNQLDYPDVPFAGGTVADSGCGVTCLAMVATYLLDEEHLPDELAIKYDFGESNAHRMENAAKGLGLDFEKVYQFPTALELLKQGKIIIVLVGEKSIFTSGGHFIVYTGITDDGKILINDPNGENYKLYPNEFEYGFETWQAIAGWRGCWVFG